MDTNQGSIENFEYLLKKQCDRKIPALYKDNTVKSNNINKKYEARDVISNVSLQLKAIQNADIVKSKINTKSMEKYKNNCFLPLNLLNIEEPPQLEHANNKFETQCFSGTQLVNILEDAEAVMDANGGITQEFDTSFNHKLIEDTEISNKNKSNEDLKLISPENQDISKTSEEHFPILDITLKESPIIPINIEKISQEEEIDDKIPPNEDSTQIINETIDIEGNKNDLGVIIEDRPKSPVLINKSKRKSNTPSPIIVSLDRFEKFESIANAVIEENLDIETTKHLINSQIMDQEFCIQTDFVPGFSEVSKPISPILKINDCIMINRRNENMSDAGSDKRTESLKDEILFSSDEEDGYIPTDVQDLPFTCVLETSFYDQSGVLDKTMYVGFQTASNKPIQVNSTSFSKAQSFLGDVESVVKEPTLTELVENLDNSKNDIKAVTNENDEAKLDPNDEEIEAIFGNNDSKDFIKAENNNEGNFFENDMNKDQETRLSQKRKFEGFKTASNKRIKLSEEALSTCKRVFQDIDLNEPYEEVQTEKDLITEIVEPKIEIKELEDEKIVDESILREFEDVDMPFDDFTENNNVSSSVEIGFKTASNKNIEISDKAIEKTKDIFKDIDSKEFDDKISCKNPYPDVEKSNLLNGDKMEEKLIGFKTASNKNIKISDKALEKTKNIFENIDSMNINAHKPKKESHVEPFINSPKTNKPIPVSKMVSPRTRNIFKNIEFTDDENTKNANKNSAKERRSFDVSDSALNRNSFMGFKTGNNKEIKISDQALAKTKNIFQDIDDIELKSKNDSKNENMSRHYNDTKNNNAKLDVNLPSMNTFIGFKTANNKNIKISEKALAKTKNIFQDIEFTDINTNDNSTKHENEVSEFNKPSSSKAFLGFKTASNKTVKISEQGLAKTKNIFQDIGLNDLDTETTKSENDLAKSEQDRAFDTPSCSKGFVGFKTASNKTVKVSDEALAKTKNIFQDIEFNDLDAKAKNENVIHKSDNENAFVGFKTASNKAVKISHEALAKTKNIFQDIELNDDTKAAKIANDKPFVGFKTASNKAVKISEGALAKTKNIFQDIDTNLNKLETNDKATDIKDKLFHEGNDVIDQKKENMLNFGFKTANNKKVEISTEALAKSKKVFQEIDNEIKKTEDLKGFSFKTANDEKVNISQDSLVTSKRGFNDNTGFKGFQTASDKKVKISQEALARTKKLFQDIVINDNITIEKPKKYTNTNLKTEITKNDSKINENAIEKDIEIIDTQILNNFEETLYTEDFKTPKKACSKRSGSPILSCPKSKRRKFETPYSNERINKIKQLNEEKVVSTHKYDENYKRHKNMALKDLENIRIYDGKIDEYVTKFSFDELLNFEFESNRNDLTNNTMNISDLKTYFFNTINKKIVPENWFENHVKLILWKLLSYEIKFPKCMKNICTAKNVLQQLKYRYDKELYNSSRPALRKIFERDDVSTRTIVLCVVNIYADGAKVDSVTNASDKVELLLTDGWYCIMATTDRMLAKLVYDRRIVVGTKLVTHGAELINCEQGVAPWEDTSSVRLKLFGNSTRRARWHTRLGYHGNAAILSHLSAVSTDGGKVAKLRVLVTRVYPAMYVEKFEDGSTVTRSERLESIHQMKYESERQMLLEKLYEEVEKEFSDQESPDSDIDSRGHLDTGSQIVRAMKRSKDLDFKSHLTTTQKNLLEDHNTKQREKVLQNIQNRIEEKLKKNGLNVSRNVVMLLKVRVADVVEKNGEVLLNKAMLSIWKPNEALTELLREGTWLEIMNVVPTAVRYSEVQISAGRQSIFNIIKYKEKEHIKPYTQTLKRTCYDIKDLSTNPTMTTDFNEIDTIGVIVIIDEIDQKNQNFQNIYLADLNKNMICVNFWGGIKKFGYENILDTGQVVYGSNLQKRVGNTKKSIPHYRVTDLSLFTKTPKNENARRKIDDLNKQFNNINKVKFCADCLVLRNNYAIIKNTENVSPYRFNDSKNVSKQEDLNLTGLDFESTFKQTDTELSPKSLLRKKRVNEKIAKLKKYGEPPPLSPIHIINKSTNADKDYKSPLISKSDVSTSVAMEKQSSTNVAINEKENTTNIQTSPVIGMNRTYVKRSVNPVKLDFNVNNESVDHFAEEFDGSPPLSLD